VVVNGKLSITSLYLVSLRCSKERTPARVFLPSYGLFPKSDLLKTRLITILFLLTFVGFSLQKVLIQHFGCPSHGTFCLEQFFLVIGLYYRDPLVLRLNVFA
jgi:hypothetical protein